MKVRFGHVSNSSTSSFCGIGIFTKEIPDDWRKSLTEETLKKISEKKWGGYDGENIDTLSFYDLDRLNEDFTTWELYDMEVIGKEFSEMRDDQTLAEFKEETKKAIQSLFKPETEIKPHYIEEAGRDD